VSTAWIIDSLCQDTCRDKNCCVECTVMKFHSGSGEEGSEGFRNEHGNRIQFVELAGLQKEVQKWTLVCINLNFSHKILLKCPNMILDWSKTWGSTN
jgi:hypothetical protein